MYTTPYHYLGTIEPGLEWITYPNPGINGKSLKIVFEGLNSENIKKVWSAILLRRHIATHPQSTYTKPFRITPTLNHLVVNNDFKYFEELGWYVYDWQILLIIRKRRYNVEEPIYLVSLYED